MAAEGGDCADPRILQLRATILQSNHDIATHEHWDKERACVILSGGRDSSIAACAGRQPLGLRAAFTVLASPGATDRPFAAAVAAAAGLQHRQLDLSLEDVLQELPTCVRVLQSFDPMTLRNDVAVCAALRAAAAAGFTCAVMGDAADELFGGYNFTHRLDDAAWQHNRERMARLMRFGSVPLGRHFGLFVASPFNQPAVIQAAMQFSKADCVQLRPAGAGTGACPQREQHEHKQQDTVQQEDNMQGQQAQQQAQPEPGPSPPPLLGKMPLRLAFPEGPTCWRGKDPIEVGCGTTELGDRPWLPQPAEGYFSRLISDTELRRGGGRRRRKG
ncbi:hypothetical protein ABPG75_006487 [Micractinium tetrahymenae]